MKKVIEMIMMVALFVLAFGAQAEAKEFKDSVVGIHYTQRIETNNGFKYQDFTGAGFFVEKNLVVTSLHFLSGKPIHSLKVQIDNKLYYGRVVFKSKTDDLMFIKTFHRETPLPVCNNVHINERYGLFIGSAQPVYVRMGNVTNTSGSKFFGDVQVIDGDSGAPAISVQNKCVMGIAVEQYRRTNVSGYVNFRAIKQALEQYKK